MAYGLRPHRMGAGGGYSSGGFTQYQIADGETDDMYAGGLALQEASGYVTALAVTPTGATAILSTVGVFGGFHYLDADGEPVHSQRYIGNAGNTKAFAFVYDDPKQQFIILSDGPTTQADVGGNAPVVSSTGTATDITQGDTSSGLSTIVLDDSAINTTATLALRIVGLPQNGENEISSTPHVIVTLNPAVHQLLNATGLHT